MFTIFSLQYLGLLGNFKNEWVIVIYLAVVGGLHWGALWQSDGPVGSHPAGT